MSAPPVCFLRGTKIRTMNGECNVEDLAIGDMVMTVRGAALRVKWIGRMSYKKTKRSWQRTVLPVKISRNALGQGTPHRDLFISRNHEVLLDGAFVLARHLVNGDTVRLCDMADSQLTYYHVSLATHEAIFAEGLPCESLNGDAAHRERFDNFVEYARLYPDEKDGWLTPFAPSRKPSFAERLRKAVIRARKPSVDA